MKSLIDKLSNVAHPVCISPDCGISQDPESGGFLGVARHGPGDSQSINNSSTISHHNMLRNLR